MSQINNYDKNMFASIQDGIDKILEKYLIAETKSSIYHFEALNEVCFFLAENDIEHQFTVVPAPSGAECDEIIALMWKDGASYGNRLWYSRGNTCAKTIHKLTITVAADDVEDIVRWIEDAAMNGVEIISYEKEEFEN